MLDRTERTIANGQTDRLVDSFGRQITYLRMSVTDRCDFRCGYCMAENMTFLPKADLLTLEELETIADAFIARGVRRIRITGGEPLVRRNVMQLFAALGERVSSGSLDEWTVTTNGSQLSRFAGQLVANGLRRVNVSLDTLYPDRFRDITRWGRLEKVLAGLKAASEAGLRVKINAVALRGVNDDEFDRMIDWCGAEGFDFCLIETMPVGAVAGGRAATYLPLSGVRADLETRWTLEDSDYATGGPARYVTIRETGGRMGFITPLSHNFCADCNRVRLTCTGRLYMCLGQDDSADLRRALRDDPTGTALNAALDDAMLRKPEGHEFAIDRAAEKPAVSRHMNVTGG